MRTESKNSRNRVSEISDQVRPFVSIFPFFSLSLFSRKLPFFRLLYFSNKSAENLFLKKAGKIVRLVTTRPEVLKILCLCENGENIGILENGENIGVPRKW